METNAEGNNDFTPGTQSIVLFTRALFSKVTPYIIKHEAIAVYIRNVSEMRTGASGNAILKNKNIPAVMQAIAPNNFFSETFVGIVYNL